MGKARQLAGHPPYTAQPNYFVDQLAPILSGTHFKVLVFIWRKLQGWHKDSDFISYGQIQKGAGVSRRVVWEAVRLFEKAGIYGVRRREGRRNIMRIFLIPEADPAEVTRLLTEQVKSTRNPQHERRDPFPEGTLTCSPTERDKPGTRLASEHTKESIKENTKDGAAAPPLPPPILKPENPEPQPATAGILQGAAVMPKPEDPGRKEAEAKFWADWEQLAKSRSP